MKPIFLITIFCICRLRLVCRVGWNNLRKGELILRLHQVSITTKGETFDNKYEIQFHQKGALGILINSFPYLVVSNQGKLIIPSKLLVDDSIELTFFGIFQIRKMTFQVSELVVVYSNLSAPILGDLPSNHISMSTPSVRSGVKKIPFIKRVKMDFKKVELTKNSVAIKKIRPVYRVNKIKAKINILSLKSELNKNKYAK